MKIYKIADSRHYLETYVDDKPMMGTDGTLILESTELFGDSWSSTTAKIRQIVEERIEHLKRLAHGVKTHLRNAKKIELKLVNSKGDILNAWDVTNQVVGFGELLNQGISIAKPEDIERDLGI
jgi:hypothetical protein